MFFKNTFLLSVKYSVYFLFFLICLSVGFIVYGNFVFSCLLLGCLKMWHNFVFFMLLKLYVVISKGVGELFLFLIIIWTICFFIQRMSYLYVSKLYNSLFNGCVVILLFCLCARPFQYVEIFNSTQAILVFDSFYMSVMFINILPVMLTPVYFIFSDYFVLNIIAFYFNYFLLFLLIGIFIFLLLDSLQFFTFKRFLTWEVVIIFLCLIVFSLFFIYSNDLFLTFLNLIGLNIVVYALLISEGFNKNVIEGALKYFFLSTISSLFFIGGLVILYSIWKTTNLTTLNLLFQSYINDLLLCGQKNIYNNSSFFFNNNDFFFLSFLTAINNNIIYVHLFYVIFFILISFIFKLALFPLHSWAAEVYSVLSFKMLFVFIVVLKSVFFIKFIHIFIYAFNLYNSYAYFFFKVLFLCIVFGSIFVGSITALFEDKLRKILAYSSTNNLGFIFISTLTSESFILSGNVFSNNFGSGLFAAILFLLVYLASMVVLLAVFSVSSLYITQFKYISDLSRVHFFLLFIIIVLFFSFAGLPPLAGFFIKFYIVVYSWSLNYVFFSVFIIFFSVVSCYYYLRVINVICFSSSSVWLLTNKVFFLMSTWAYNNLIKHVYSRLLFIGSVLIICYFIFILFLSIVFFVFLIPFLINWCELIVLSLALWLV